jgi:hypothetical protein
LPLFDDVALQFMCAIGFTLNDDKTILTYNNSLHSYIHMKTICNHLHERALSTSAIRPLSEPPVYDQSLDAITPVPVGMIMDSLFAQKFKWGVSDGN